MKSKKAQAAMEFLMTYGWAILIVIAVVAALYATGVFRLPRGGVGRCSPCFPPGAAMAYVDHNADRLVVRVGSHDIDVTQVVARDVNTQDHLGESPKTFTPPVTGDANTRLEIYCNDCFDGDVNVEITYDNLDTGLTNNKVSVTLHGAEA